MGAITEPLPVKLIVSLLCAEPECFEQALSALTHTWGPVDYHSLRLPFDQTDYYEQELGKDLQREIVAMERLIDPAALAEIKCWTNQLETAMARDDGRRRINLDPGYIEQGKLVLATTKNYAHRIYLSRGIYAEVTLIYRQKAFQALPWSYPDYASEAYTQMLSEIRRIYSRQLRTR